MRAVAGGKKPKVRPTAGRNVYNAAYLSLMAR